MTKLQYFILAVIIVFTLVYGTLFHLFGMLYVQVQFVEAEEKLCKSKGEYLVPIDPANKFRPFYMCSKQKSTRLQVDTTLSVYDLDKICGRGMVMTYKGDYLQCSDKWFPAGRLKLPRN